MKQSDSVQIVHISDLHMAYPLKRRQLQKGPAGFYGHDYALCEGLVEAIKDLVVRDDFEPKATAVVLSGDASSSGVEDEFEVCKDFLKQACKELPLVLVPGNHDHWNGKRADLRSLRVAPCGYNKLIKPDHFEDTPCDPPRIITSSSGGFRIALHGVDSNSGFRGGLNVNLFAGGRIHRSELKSLRSVLDKLRDQSDLLHILVCHHSFGRGDAEIPWPLEDASREEVLAIGREHNVLAVLTGHQHSFWFWDWSDDSVVRQVPIAEIRCATTTQGPLPNEDELIGKRPGLWQYRITLRKDIISFEPTPFVWNGNRFASTVATLLVDGVPFEFAFK